MNLKHTRTLKPTLEILEDRCVSASVRVSEKDPNLLIHRAYREGPQSAHLSRCHMFREGRLTERGAGGLPWRRELVFMSSRPEDSHRRALPDPYVNLSISYGSRCSAVSMAELPVGEECWIYSA